MTEVLVIDGIHTSYGQSRVLQGLSLKVEGGTAVALIGRNGMGKTTAMRSIIGFTPPSKGRIYFKGEDITALPSYRICRMGVSIVPQGRRIFQSLTVKENLSIVRCSSGRERVWDLEKVFTFFPRLQQRIHNRGNQLSGGEQQMLAIGRALISNPEMILMDEPSEGLAPLIVAEIGDIIKQLKENGLSILLAEQNLQLALSVADYVYVVNKGMIVFEGSGEVLRNEEDVKREYLAI